MALHRAGTVLRLVLRIELETLGRRTADVIGAATGLDILQTQIPEVGATAHVWTDGDQRIVQTGAGATSGGADAAGATVRDRSARDIGEQLASLADLRAAGDLTDDECASAKRQLLDS